jgi:hypothetical protein
MIFPDEVEALDEVHRIVPESIMEHGHGEVGEQEGGNQNYVSSICPSMPNHNIVEDEGDYELNQDR